MKRAIILIVFAAYAALAQAAQFTLNWTDNSSNESGFRIERATGSGAFAEIATVPAGVVTYVDAGLPNSTTYSYRVRAFNAAGNSGYSNVSTATTPPPNTAPSISAISDQTVGVGVSTGALSFSVADSFTPAGSLVVTGSSSNTVLVPNGAIVLGGTGKDRTVSVTPAAGRTGTADITLTVSDGTLSASTTFTLTVIAVPTAPSGLTITAAE